MLWGKLEMSWWMSTSECFWKRKVCFTSTLVFGFPGTEMETSIQNVQAVLWTAMPRRDPETQRTGERRAPCWIISVSCSSDLHSSSGKQLRNSVTARISFYFIFFFNEFIMSRYKCCWHLSIDFFSYFLFKN